MKVELHKVASRDKLTPRRDPHFQRIEAGKFLGFRKMTAESVGEWSVRVRDTATGKQSHKSLGAFDGLPPSQRFDAAKKAAADWIAHLERGGSTEVLTVAGACAAYAAHLGDTKGKAQADEARARFRRWIDSDPLGSIDLGGLKRDHVRAWRKRLESATVGRGDNHLRSASANNRDITAIRAALRHALSEGWVSSDFAFASPLKAAPGVDGRRKLYLAPQQRRDLIAAADPEAVALIKVLCSLPLRPGAVAALRVGDWDRAQSVLCVRIDKAGAGRSVSLPADAAAVLNECARGKLPHAPLIARADGRPWKANEWNRSIKAAAAVASLDPKSCAYSLRHSTISDLISGGVDVATVAVLSGTSLLMIHRNYFHLRPQNSRDALQKLAL